MSKQKKKDKKGKSKQKEAATERADQAELEHLRQENEVLRARLESIAELARTPSPRQHASDDVEDEEYDELSRDIDDEIAEADASRESVSTDGAGRS